MSIELRILSGSRAGQTEAFEKSPITIGRHPESDLTFDPTGDLDVSTRHGEIRVEEGRYIVHDNASTNGTYVNGQRVPSGESRELRSGDVIAFGAHGPTASVRISSSRTTPFGERLTAPIPTPALGANAQAAAPRRPTQERVAMAVAEQTRGLKLAFGGAVVGLVAIAGGLYWMGHREAAQSDARLQAATAAYETSSKQLQSRLQSTNDTALINNLEREKDSLIQLARQAKGSEAAVVQQALQHRETTTRALGEMDTPSVVAANNAAIALIRAETTPDSALEATGFGVTANGVVITNRHVVEVNGKRSPRVLVKFADTPVWRKAHVARLPGDSSVDLALIQIDEPGTYPVVRGIAETVDVPVGGAIASLGFPLGTELPMDGARATTTLTIGIVSKSVSDLLQIDSYASHGSSGSPVFDGHGHVVGVIYGGPREAAGRIVYAVPSPQIAGLIKR